MGPRPTGLRTPWVFINKAMAHLFETLFVWIDPAWRNGPEQMACDEALLGRAEGPVLRIFRWTEPWVSAGYFVPWAEALATRPELPVCRRWTGGGIVVHENDFTFSLVAPRREAWAQCRPGDSYRVLHFAAAEALRAVGITASVFDGGSVAGAECFAGPVRYDVMSGARKIAGGAQRRTKSGLLHQGSIQGSGLGAEFAEVLAGHLAGQSTAWEPPEGFGKRVSALVREKYANTDFLRREVP
jgi:lipoate-protein ligase A